LAESDKVKMAEHAHAERLKGPQVEQSLDVSGNLPPLKHLPDEVEGWTVVEEPILNFYAGKGPFVSRYKTIITTFPQTINNIFLRDFMAFPVSLPDDGLVDIMTMPAVSILILRLLTCLNWDG
jgi:sphingosine kinase